MASPTQTIMFTAMPRALSIDPATLPVSVLVSPRLAGASQPVKPGRRPDETILGNRRNRAETERA